MIAGAIDFGFGMILGPAIGRGGAGTTAFAGIVAIFGVKASLTDIAESRGPEQMVKAGCFALNLVGGVAGAKAAQSWVDKFLTTPAGRRFLRHLRRFLLDESSLGRGWGRVRSTAFPNRVPFDRYAVIQGFQDHHIISDKNTLTKLHELLELAGFDLQSRKNKMFLPTNESLHPTRSIHLGRHRTEVSRNLAEQMDQIVEVGKQLEWTIEQYNEALRALVSQERQLLRSGHRALNKNMRPWAE
jgi:hypothetical protein